MIAIASSRSRTLEQRYEAEHPKLVRIEALASAIAKSADWRAKQRAIRALYAHIAPQTCLDVDPYALEVLEHQTPIERKLWGDIRSGPMLMLPQFPVGPYLLDFGDPETKIGIEADGRQWHDAERDRPRDQQLWDLHGWRIFRLQGAECCRVVEPPFGDHGWDQAEADRALDRYYLHTSEGVLGAIHAVVIRKDTGHKYFNRMHETLLMHRLADFPLYD